VDNSSIATVMITVDPVNDAPVAYGDYYNTTINVTLNLSAPGVLGNDTDDDGPVALVAVLDSDVGNGSLTLHANGSFEYIPVLDWSGVDSFTYHAYDGLENSSTVTVEITVKQINQSIASNPPIKNDIIDNTELQDNRNIDTNTNNSDNLSSERFILRFINWLREILNL
jgi:hypothetical protein